MPFHTTPDSYTKLLIHSNTSDGEAVFFDSSPDARTISVNGHAHHETDKAKFGTTSMHFDGTTDYLTVPDSADWDMSSSDATVDFWAYFTAMSTYHGLVGQSHSGDGNWKINATADGALAVGREGVNQIITANGVLVTGRWYHIAATRTNSDSTTRIYIDGELKQSGTTAVWNNASTALIIGDSLYSFTGYLDEIRVSKGIARWTDSFVPPNKPYSMVDDDFVTDVAGIEDVGDGITKLSSDIIIKSATSGSGLASDTIFSIHNDDGTTLLDAKQDGVFIGEASQTTKPQGSLHISNPVATFDTVMGETGAKIFWGTKYMNVPSSEPVCRIVNGTGNNIWHIVEVNAMSGFGTSSNVGAITRRYVIRVLNGSSGGTPVEETIGTDEVAGSGGITLTWVHTTSTAELQMTCTESRTACFVKIYAHNEGYCTYTMY